jgi:cell division protein ZapB
MAAEAPGPEDRLLTRQKGANYSPAMQAELDALEGRITQLLERFQALRLENLKLRQQVVSLESDNKKLRERLDEAGTRLESLYNRLPD